MKNDGSLGKCTDIRNHTAKSSNQDGSHAHATVAHEKFALCADLGADRIYQYEIDESNGKLIPNPNSSHFQLQEGSGPRHLVLHPNLKIGYILNELNSTISVFGYESKTGILNLVQTVSTLPEGFSGKNYPAAIRVSSNGKAIYISNRFHDSIAVFGIDDSGLLKLIQHQSTLGKTPRDFALDPSGHWLLVANQDSDSLSTFLIDPITHTLTPGSQININSPACILVL